MLNYSFIKNITHIDMPIKKKPLPLAELTKVLSLFNDYLRELESTWGHS